MENIKKFLKEHSELGYADFNKKYISTKYKILGVRIPLLKKYAKDIEPEFIELSDNLTHEEILLYGFSAVKFKSEQLEYLTNILPYIDNWATCDCIVQSMKNLNDENAYKFFSDLLWSDKEFYIRVGIVGLMRNFLKTDKIGEILKNLANIKSDAYYVKMAIAWFLAELSAINFELSFKFISQTDDKFIRNKAISKSRESYRLSIEQKEKLLELKIK